jgi:uncharacterized protein (DUF1330 family)
MCHFMAVFNPFHGRVFAADESPAVVEGKWNHQKVVLLSFPEERDLHEWESSADHQETAKDRQASSTAVTLLEKGLEPIG